MNVECFLLLCYVYVCSHPPLKYALFASFGIIVLLFCFASFVVLDSRFLFVSSSDVCDLCDPIYTSVSTRLFFSIIRRSCLIQSEQKKVDHGPLIYSIQATRLELSIVYPFQ